LTSRTFGHARLGISLAIVVIGVVGLSSQGRANPPPGPGGTVVGTPLPSGWELCILQGVGASPTQANVANLDEWQVAEGGSTNNAAAYNPFNTRQVTDPTGAPLPVAITSDGFPAFATWTAGCAATVATLLQPSMAPIVAALRAGTVSPPGIFLSDVDQSPWCAPTTQGIPCYATEILGGELLEALFSGGSGQLNDALTSFSDTGADLRSYQADASVTAVDQEALASRNDQLATTQHALALARGTLARATQALRRLAIDAYTSDSLTRSDADIPLFGASDQQDMIAQYLGNIAATVLAVRYEQAESAVKASISEQQAAQTAVAQATSVFDSATATENQALSVLEADVKNIEGGLSCPLPPIVTAAASPVDSPSSAGQLWAALQDCLAPPAPSGTLAGQSAPS